MALIGRLVRPSVLRMGARNAYVFGEQADHGCMGGPLSNPAPVNSEEPIYRNTQIDAIVAKTKGDWKEMSTEEIRLLYKAQFLETVADATAHTGEMWRIFGQTLFCISVSLWMFMGYKRFAGPQKSPTTSYTFLMKEIETDVRGRAEAPSANMMALRAAMEPDLARKREKMRAELQLEEKYEARIAHLLQDDDSKK